MENNCTKQDHTQISYHALVNKVVTFSTNIDVVDTINNDDINEEWDMSTSNINMNNQQPNSDEESMVINDDNTHNLECGFPKNIEARSATFCHPDKITIMNGVTGTLINKIILQNTDKVTLHNIGHQ